MKRFACCLALLLYVFTCTPDSMAKNLFLNSKNFDTITPEGHLFYNAAAFYQPARKALRNDDATSIVQLRDMALQGDFKALAALALITRLHEQQGHKQNANIPAQFWEDWTYRLLGEQEGGYILGAVSQGTAAILDSNERSPLFVRMGADALRRAAKAGHPEAMFGISLLADSLPDPNFRMPDKINFPIASQNMVDASYTPEILYWLGKAAARGSSRASLLMGLIYMEPEMRHLRDTLMALYFMKQAVSQGNGMAALGLNAYLDPRIIDLNIPQANCPQTAYYTALHERMRDEDGRLDMEKAGPTLHSGLGQGALYDLFRQMSEGKDGYTKCLTSEEEFFALLAESRVEYEAIRASLEAKQRDLDVLYARARARLPELRAAYEKALQGQEPENVNKNEHKEPEETTLPPGGVKWGDGQCSLDNGASL